MTESCEFIRDLIPVAASGAASEETKAMVQAHIAECPACKAEYERCLGLPRKPARAKPKPMCILFFLLKLLGVAALLLLGTVPAFGSIRSGRVVYFYSTFALFGAGVYTAFAFRRGRYLVVAAIPFAVMLTYLTAHGFYLLQINISQLLPALYDMCYVPTIFGAAGLISGLLLRYALRRKVVGSAGKSWLSWLRSFVGRKPLYLRIPAGIAGVLIFIPLCSYVFGIAGDPVSYLIADGKMREYYNKNYSSKDYRYLGTNYDGNSTYSAIVQSPSAPYVSFSIRYFGQTVTDTYQNIVIQANASNFKALCDQLVREVNGDLSGFSPYLYSTLDKSRVTDPAVAASSGKKQLDAQIISDYLSVTLYSSGEFSPGGIAELLTGYYNELKSKDIVFSTYSIYIAGEPGQASGKVIGITPAQIEGGNLERLLQAAKDSPVRHNADIYYIEGAE